MKNKKKDDDAEDGHDNNTKKEEEEEEGTCHVSHASGGISDATQYSLVRRIGDGSYSDVYIAEHVSTGEVCALKVVDKYHIIKNHAVDGIRREKQLLERMRGEESIVELLFTYQDSSNLYIGLELCMYGELYEQIDQAMGLGGMDVGRIRMYAAEIVVMLEALRRYGVVHRDLKPENILLGAGGHLKLIDFGCAKDVSSSSSEDRRMEGCDVRKKRTLSLVGTAEYVPPEVLENSGEVSYGVDLWALGCIIYHMCAGKTPFKGGSEYLTFQNIVKNDVDMGPVMERGGEVACDLVKGLLQSVPEKRLGYASLDALKSHEFFKGIAWDSLYRSKAPAPLTKRPLTVGEEEDDDEFDWELRSLRSQLHATSISSNQS
ncbi:hypothetical protein M9435_006197 [Picochlorum sp. BPE23]|nr:hypothetical protein M9435_006197 [Picochlorum sp. BPE23]